jgi:hypothetical protein
MIHPQIKDQIDMAWILDQTEAVGRAIEDTQAAVSVKGGVRDPLAFIARLGDLTRSTSFLWVEANLKTLEHYSRVTQVGQECSRGLALGTVSFFYNKHEQSSASSATES